MDIFVLQFLHFPLRKRKLSIGINSKTESVLPQEGQNDLPPNPRPLLNLIPKTLRKLPTISPKTKRNAY